MAGLEHYNIQIHVQKVVTTPVDKFQPVTGKDREVTDVLQIAVTAGSSDEAFAKVIRLLEVEQESLGPGGALQMPGKATSVSRGT